MQTEFINFIEISVIVIFFLLFKKYLYPVKLRMIVWGIIGIRAVLPSKLLNILLPVVLNLTAYDTESVTHGRTIDFFVIARIIGIIGMFLFLLIDRSRIEKLKKSAEEISHRTFKTNKIPTAFTVGLINPVFFIPAKASTEESDYMIKHEMMHVKHHDCLYKQFGIIVLALNWYNPIIWIAYHSMCTDIEQACDDAVLQGTSEDYRKSYAKTIVKYSISENNINPHVKFGAHGIKERISNILTKRPTTKHDFIVFLVILISVILIALTKISFNQKSATSNSDIPGIYNELDSNYYIQDGDTSNSIVIEYK